MVQTPYDRFIGMPIPYEGASDDRLLYQFGSNSFLAYYFNDDKLKGGAKYKSGESRNSQGDFVWYQFYYKEDQLKINELMGFEGTEIITWTVTEERQSQYLNQSNGQGVSLAVENGHATVSTVWELNGVKAKLDLTRAYQKGTGISYTIYKM